MKIRLDENELTEILEDCIESKTGIKVASRPLATRTTRLKGEMMMDKELEKVKAFADELKADLDKAIASNYAYLSKSRPTDKHTWGACCNSNGKIEACCGISNKIDELLVKYGVKIEEEEI